MRFSKLEMTAIMNMVHTMIIADGRIDEEETSVISAEMIKFNIPLEDFKEIFIKGRDMDPVVAVEIVSKMTYGQREYVAAYLGTVMAIDGDIDEKEMALWRLLSKMCGLPTMSVGDAIKYMAEN